MKNELIQVIARYVDINPDEVKITMNQDGREQRLVADIPILATHKRKIG
jgi:cell division topological specificity factor